MNAYIVVSALKFVMCVIGYTVTRVVRENIGVSFHIHVKYVRRHSVNRAI